MSEEEKTQVEPVEEVEAEVEVKVEVTEKETPVKKPKTSDPVSAAINSFMDTLESALTGRGNSVMVRVNDDALKKLDMLVASGICKSRSESAAFLLQRGIEGSETLFNRIENVTNQITSMRQELLDWVQEEK
jgi:hypothetical protein